MRGNEILLSAEPKGRYVEGIISGTPLPGSLMEVVPGCTPVGGRLTYRAYSGSKQPTNLILLPDHLEGATATTAYVSGSRGFMYTMLSGDEANLLVGQTAGTGAAVAIGDQLEGEPGGLLIPLAGTGSASYTAQEAIADIGLASTLVFVARN
jgi:hypothetical protein